MELGCWVFPCVECTLGGAGLLACPRVPTASIHSPVILSQRSPITDGQHLRGADASKATLSECDGDIAAAAALVVVALEVGVGGAAALTVGVIGPGTAAPVAVGVLRTGAVAELAAPLILVGAGEAGAVPLRGEDELAAQTGEEPGTAPLPGAARGTDTHSRLHGS